MTEFEKTAIRRMLERLRDAKVISQETSAFCVQRIEFDLNPEPPGDRLAEPKEPYKTQADCLS